MDVAVLGLGLIGGSVLRALAASGHRVLGFDADPATRATARTAGARAPSGARWQVTQTARDAITAAELVVLAVPLPALPAVLTEVAATGFDGLVTDVTSVKGPVRDLIDAHLPGAASFVGGHPMAGREVSGFNAGDARLFDGCAWVLCLEPGRTALPDWLDLADLVTSLGARAVPATADEHDRAVAAVSHVPHLLASALARAVADEPLAAARAAGSFRDGSRVAASASALVAAMCGGNAAAVGPALDRAQQDLAAMRAALDDPEPVAALRPLLAPGNAARRAWPPAAGEPVELPARVDTLLELGRAGGWV
ncbi:MAG TPA: prephenate dehydrogenase/arogenate dehydrogenase family protein, partial [Actinoplanes sp.]|nr:prephenate dehydrogenase/arogenate dehydrogenase family protein [Actinoplanes sp.]